MEKVKIAAYIRASNSYDALRQKERLTDYIRTNLPSCPCTIFADRSDDARHVQYNKMMFHAVQGMYRTILTCSKHNLEPGIVKIMRLTGLHLITLDEQSVTTILYYSKGGTNYYGI